MRVRKRKWEEKNIRGRERGCGKARTKAGEKGVGGKEMKEKIGKGEKSGKGTHSGEKEGRRERMQGGKEGVERRDQKTGKKEGVGRREQMRGGKEGVGRGDREQMEIEQVQYARRADKSGMRAVEKDTLGMYHNAIEKKWNKWIIMYQVKSGERRRRKKSQTKKDV